MASRMEISDNLAASNKIIADFESREIFMDKKPSSVETADDIADTHEWQWMPGSWTTSEEAIRACFYPEMQLSLLSTGKGVWRALTVLVGDDD